MGCKDKISMNWHEDLTLCKQKGKKFHEGQNFSEINQMNICVIVNYLLCSAGLLGKYF